MKLQGTFVDGVDAVFHYAANPEVRVSTVNPRCTSMRIL
jgi:hypothetical protein